VIDKTTQRHNLNFESEKHGVYTLFHGGGGKSISDRGKCRRKEPKLRRIYE
jgi:hypothetical protein